MRIELATFTETIELPGLASSREPIAPVKPVISAQLIQQRLYGSDALTMLRLVRRSKELVSAWRRFRQIIKASRNDPRCILTRSLVDRHLAHVESELLGA